MDEGACKSCCLSTIVLQYRAKNIYIFDVNTLLNIYIGDLNEIEDSVMWYYGN
jgi:Fe-S cluster biogenesis protein NfuA